MTSFMTTATLVLGAITLMGAAGAASAHPWMMHHPRRVEVNMRLERIDHRINMERRDGELTRGQARDLRLEDRGLRGEERFYASHDRSHLTRGEYRRLNRQEDRLNREAGRY